MPRENVKEHEQKPQPTRARINTRGSQGEIPEPGWKSKGYKGGANRPSKHNRDSERNYIEQKERETRKKKRSNLQSQLKRAVKEIKDRSREQKGHHAEKLKEI